MAQGDATSQDVPGRYDVVINGKGYSLLDSIEPSIPFRTHRAIYAYSPTFVDRQNVSAGYGDNTQDFWMTFNQNDWSLGEQQKYFRPNLSGSDGDASKRRYWAGSYVNVATPGQVSMGQNIGTTGAAATAVCAGGGTSTAIFTADATNLYENPNNGSATNHGAHGAGGTPCQYGIWADNFTNIYIAGGSGGTIRKWNGSAFSTFSSVAGPQSGCFLNNAIYVLTGTGSGGSNIANSLQVLDSSGNATNLFTWKTGDGNVVGVLSKLKPFGGKLLILRYVGAESSGGELWIYDGQGTSRLAKFPNNFLAYDIEVVNGVVFIAGSLTTVFGQVSTQYQPAVFYYANGNIGLLWKANAPTTNLTHPTITGYQGGLVIADESTGNYLLYDPALGGVSTIATFTTATVSLVQAMAAAQTSFVHLRGASLPTYYPILNSTPTVSSATVTTSLYDFDSSLTKQFRGIVVEYVAATDGNGGSVDIAYRVGDVDGSYTTLQTGVTSGTEYNLTGISGRAISVKVTLNKGTSTNGPILKRIYVRAAPQQQTFEQRQFILDLSGIGFKDPVQLNDGTFHPLSGHEQAANLITAIKASSPFSVTDRFGTYTTCLCDPPNCEIYEVREGNDSPPNSGGFVAKITVRAV